MEIQSFKELTVWQMAMDLANMIYDQTESFPQREYYGLGSQIRKSAVSIPSNIAEGVGRNYKKDTVQFLHIARGSLYELETLLNIAVMVEIISEKQFQPFILLIDENVKILNGLIRAYEKRADLN